MGLFDELQSGTQLRPGDGDFWDAEFCRCDIPPIDYILGGGFALGRISEIFGNFSSGKTMILYSALIANTRRGGVSILNEAEGAFNAEFYSALGGDPSQLLVRPVDTCEEVFDHIKDICTKVGKSKDQVPVLIGWDSVAATGSKHLIEAGMEKRDLSIPILMSQGFKLVTTALAQTKVALICTNQTRDAINSKDSATSTPGGKSLPFHASQRLELRYDGGSKTSLISAVDEGTEKKSADDFSVEIGRWVVAINDKNKCGPPKGKCRLPIYTHTGRQHPEYDRKTVLGIDLDQALFEFYRHADFLLPNKDRVVQEASPGWYCLSSLFDSSQEKFRYRQWPVILDGVPMLRTLPYDYETLFLALTPAPPAPEAPPATEQPA